MYTLDNEAIKYFYANLNKQEEDSCWNWLGSKTNEGYGRIYLGYKQYVVAHRVSYEIYKGEIPDGLVIDHLCRNPSCVNPKHLEAVTDKINILRGVGPCAVNAKKTHCSNGHLLSEDNLVPSAPRGRICLICQKERARISAKKKRDNIKAARIEARRKATNVL